MVYLHGLPILPGLPPKERVNARVTSWHFLTAFRGASRMLFTVSSARNFRGPY